MRTTTHQQSILYSSALFLLLVGAAGAKKEKCNPQDKKVLLGIQKYYHNANVFSSWRTSTDCCADWSMVECDDTTHRITSLTVSTDGLPGVIAPSVGDLPYLKSLDLHKLPNITGPIPNSIAKLSKLEFLRLEGNGLTGALPDFLHTLKKLNYINLSYNKLSGSIPASLALVPSLNYLILDHNRLTGSTPSTFKNAEIYGLTLSHNQLSGPIPTSLGKVDFIYTLDLSWNNLNGDASFLFGRNKSVTQMYLSGNQLAFDFSKIQVPSRIQSLLLDHNKIYGGFPPLLTGLQDFNVSYNRLCGKIPTELGNAFLLGNTFDKYSFIHNKCLCGTPLDACK